MLETAEKLWVAEKVEGGPRNISNCMSIRVFQKNTFFQKRIGGTHHASALRLV